MATSKTSVSGTDKDNKWYFFPMLLLFFGVPIYLIYSNYEAYKASLLLYKPCPVLKVQNSATEVLKLRDRSIIVLEHSYSPEDRLPEEIVKIECHEGYYFADREKEYKIYKCLNDSTWNYTEEAVCIKDTSKCLNSLLPEEELFLFNLTVKDITHLNNQSALTVEYECISGYTSMYEDNFVYDCHDNGTWNNSNVPQCIKVCHPLVVQNGALKVLTSDNRSDHHLPGEVVEMKCNADYYLKDNEGDYIYKCLDGGVWNNTAVAVCLYECKSPPISDGEASELNIKQKPIGSSGLIVKYQCKDNHTLLYEGNFVYECNDGKWNNSNIPQCVNECFTFEISENTLTQSEAKTYCEDKEKTLLQQALKVKWKVYHAKITEMITSTDQFVWVDLLRDRTVPASTREDRIFKFSDATTASILFNGSEFTNDDLFIKWGLIEPSDYDGTESAVEIRLIDGSLFFNDVSGSTAGTTRAFCEKRNPSCFEGITCPEIEDASYNITKSYLDDQLVRGVEITYKCKDGFVSTSDNMSTTCTENGWSGNVRCVKECEEPPDADQYAVEYEYSFQNGEYWPGTTATYRSCKNDNFLLLPDDVTNGRNVLTCQRTGRWDPGSAPNCALSCEVEPAQCRLIDEFYTYEDDDCQDKLTEGQVYDSLLIWEDRDRNVDVGVPGNWTSRTRILYCEGDRYIDKTHGREYTCKTGTPWTPYPFSTCLKDCESDHTQFEQVANFTFSNWDESDVNFRDGVYLKGAEVEYTCNPGFVANNGGEATCTWDGSWNPPINCSVIK